MPRQGDGLETLTSFVRRHLLDLALLHRVDAGPQNLPGVGVLLPSSGQRHFGADPDGHQLLRASKPVPRAPEFAAAGCDQEKEAAAVGQLIPFLPRFRLPHLHFSELHFSSTPISFSDIPPIIPPFAVGWYG